MTDEKIIGITMRIVEASGYDEPRDALAHNMISFACKTFPGDKVLLLPNLGGEATLSYCERMGVNRFIFSGGDNPLETPRRDESEMALFSYAEKHRLPVLGICRGMQMMGRYFGVGLVPVQNHVRTRHILGGHEFKGQEVNSYHNFSLGGCPDGFEVTAHNEKDDCIEAIRHKELPWQAWMWHPEREENLPPDDMNRIWTLFE